MGLIEGGEIGSGQSLISIFEVVPQDAFADTAKTHDATLAEIKLRYKKPNEKDDVHTFSYSSNADVIPFGKIERCYRFSASVAMFGSLLRSSQYTRNMTWNDIVSWAVATADPNDILQKEFVSIVQQAKTLYTKTKKKKGNKEEN
jgi:Ca-activated chloride channel family protein